MLKERKVSLRLGSELSIGVEPGVICHLVRSLDVSTVRWICNLYAERLTLEIVLGKGVIIVDVEILVLDTGRPFWAQVPSWCCSCCALWAFYKEVQKMKRFLICLSLCLLLSLILTLPAFAAADRLVDEGTF